jgi:hypothetical protein
VTELRRSVRQGQKVRFPSSPSNPDIVYEVVATTADSVFCIMYGDDKATSRYDLSWDQAANLGMQLMDDDVPVTGQDTEEVRSAKQVLDGLLHLTTAWHNRFSTAELKALELVRGALWREAAPGCDMDGDDEDERGVDHYWHCENAATQVVDGMNVCDKHAEQLGVETPGG